MIIESNPFDSPDGPVHTCARATDLGACCRPTAPTWAQCAAGLVRADAARSRARTPRRRPAPQPPLVFPVVSAAARRRTRGTYALGQSTYAPAGRSGAAFTAPEPRSRSSPPREVVNSVSTYALSRQPCPLRYLYSSMVYILRGICGLGGIAMSERNRSGVRVPGTGYCTYPPQQAPAKESFCPPRHSVG